MSDSAKSTPGKTSPIIEAAYVGVDGGIYRVRVPVTKIWLNRAEGPSELCRDWTFASWHHVDFQLGLNARTAPKGGAYDKHDFKVTWADGTTYSGRFDLEGDDPQPSLSGHIRKYLSWIVNDPRAMQIFSPKDQEEAAGFLKIYDLQQHKPTPAPEGWEIRRDYSREPLKAGEPALENLIYGL